MFGKIDDRLIELKSYSIQICVIMNYADFLYSILHVYYHGSYIAEYKLVFTMEGEVTDDILRTQDAVYINRLVDVYNNAIEISKNALKAGINPEIVAEITELDLKFIMDLKQEIKN